MHAGRALIYYIFKFINHVILLHLIQRGARKSKALKVKGERMSLDKETVRKVSSLAKIRMNDEELERMAPQLSKIIGFVEQLNEVDTDNVEPLASVVDITLELREDKITDGDCVDRVLANAPESTQGYFVVPKVVE